MDQASRDRRWCEVAGLVLVRQRPGSAKGVTFITIEDESGAANLVVWTKVFEAYRRVVLGAGMIVLSSPCPAHGHICAACRTRSTVTADAVSV